MRRTQLFLDDPLWEALHARARSEKTTISELVRQAARERYLGSQETRMAAMQSFVGIRKSRARTANSSEEIRELRRGSRLDRLGDR
jgi:predicted DNA-binding ribbon-helix-helix protein